MCIEYKKRVVVVKNSCKFFFFYFSERKGFEPLVQLLVRFISNEILSASQSSLQRYESTIILLNRTRPLGLEPRTSGFGDLRSTN